MHRPASYLVSFEHRSDLYNLLAFWFLTVTLFRIFHFVAVKLRMTNWLFEFSRLRARQLWPDELLGTWLAQMLLAHVEHEGVWLEIWAFAVGTFPVTAFKNIARTTSRSNLFRSFWWLLHLVALIKIYNFIERAKLFDLLKTVKYNYFPSKFLTGIESNLSVCYE